MEKTIKRKNHNYVQMFLKVEQMLQQKRNIQTNESNLSIK